MLLLTFSPSPRIPRGDRVMARWREGAQREFPDWYPGEIVRANEDAT
jgi:hypothetical protein